MASRLYRRAVFCVVALVLVVLLPNSARASDNADDLKVKALTEFKNANYPAAIAYLHEARELAPDDAEVYYYLGYFTHYLCYDSVPLSGFGREKSDEVLAYLRRAVELDPGYGDAFYFIGAEYGARARDELQGGNAAGAAEQFRLGRKEGGYPDWLLEFGRNLLKSCERDAILFTGGDPDANAVQYLQMVAGFRTDVTVIPIALLNRPWFVMLLKKGLDDAVRPAPVSWSETQVMKMRPYKWQTRTILVPVAESVAKRYEMDAAAFEWELASNEGGEEAGHLDAGRAVFADILVTNGFERPVYFSSGVSSAAFNGLHSHIQVRGVARQLLPIVAPSDVDAQTTSALMLDAQNFVAVPTVRDHNMPRASNMLVNYRVSYLYLAIHYTKADDVGKVESVLFAMKKNVPEDILPMSESLRGSVAQLEKWVTSNR